MDDKPFKLKRMKGIDKLFNHESKDGTWEITHKEDEKKIYFTYFKLDESDFQAETISLDYDEFNDLIRFANSLQRFVKKK